MVGVFENKVPSRLNCGCVAKEGVGGWLVWCYIVGRGRIFVES